MIGYFTRAGNVEVAQAFIPYERAFNKILRRKIEGKDFGDGLDLILIEYTLEGGHLRLPAKPIRVLAYSKKERALSVVVGVSKGFSDLPEVAKRQFIVNTTLESARLVQEKMLRLRFTEIDFKSLLGDIQECAVEYLKLPEIKYFPAQED